MTSLAPKLLAAAAALALHAVAQAVPLYLQFAGNGAQGELNGNAFSDAAWRFEYQVETGTADLDASAESSLFMGAITGGHVGLNGSTYELAGQSATGLVALASYAGAYDGIFVNPASGGYLQFITNHGTTFPALFGNVNDLSSANLGTTVRDTTTDPFNNSSYVSYQQQYDWWSWPMTTHPGVTLAGGGWMNIFAASGPASGNFSVTVSDHSMASAMAPAITPVPEPGTLLLTTVGIAGLGLARRRQRKD